MSCWVLTFEINEYYQSGEYFLAVFKEKPSAERIQEHLPAWAKSGAEKLVQDGGGRRGSEEEWFFLKEVEFS